MRPARAVPAWARGARDQFEVLGQSDNAAQLAVLIKEFRVQAGQHLAGKGDFILRLGQNWRRGEFDQKSRQFFWFQRGASIRV